MTTIGEQLITGPLWRRLAHGFRAGLFFGAVLGALVLMTSLDGRYQRIRSGTEFDAWAMAAAWTIGCGFSVTVASACGALWRNRWTAALATALTVFPVSILVSAAYEPHGVRAYHIDWEESSLLPLIFAVVTPIYYGEAVRRIREGVAKRKARERDAKP
jgi:hypothetical protein